VQKYRYKILVLLGLFALSPGSPIKATVGSQHCSSGATSSDEPDLVGRVAQTLKLNLTNLLDSLLKDLQRRQPKETEVIQSLGMVIQDMKNSILLRHLRNPGTSIIFEADNAEGVVHINPKGIYELGVSFDQWRLDFERAENAQEPAWIALQKSEEVEPRFVYYVPLEDLRVFLQDLEQIETSLLTLEQNKRLIVESSRHVLQGVIDLARGTLNSIKGDKEPHEAIVQMLEILKKNDLKENTVNARIQFAKAKSGLKCVLYPPDPNPDTVGSGDSDMLSILFKQIDFLENELKLQGLKAKDIELFFNPDSTTPCITKIALIKKRETIITGYTSAKLGLAPEGINVLSQHLPGIESYLLIFNATERTRSSDAASNARCKYTEFAMHVS
jgi:hypothetical protein